MPGWDLTVPAAASRRSQPETVRCGPATDRRRRARPCAVDAPGTGTGHGTIAEMPGDTPHDSPPPEGRGKASRAGKGSGNRKWLLVIFVTPLLVVLIALVAFTLGPSEPSVQLTPPAGYQAITDAYYAYAIPSAWSQDPAGTDNNGDFYYRGTGGWVGETLRIRDTPPVLGESPPPALASFGQLRATPYQLTAGSAATVPGADAAWSYDLVRPGAAPDRVVDAWVRSSHTEIWLVVAAGGPASSTIVSSLRA